MRLFYALLLLAGLSWLLVEASQDSTYQASKRADQSSFVSASVKPTTISDEQLPAPGLTFGPDFWSASASTFESDAGDESAQPALTAAPLPTPIISITKTSRRDSTPDSASHTDDVSGAILSSLRDLQQPNGQTSDESNSRFNPGVRSGPLEASAVLTPAVTPTPDGQLPWVTGISTGLASLAFMHPKARPMALRQIETLEKARVRNVFLAVLADGTFDFDAEFLSSSIARLSTDGRQLTLLLYLSSGPTMRRSDTTPITAAFARYDPESFREAIRIDPSTRFRYTNIVRQVRSLVLTTRAENSANKVLIAPSLEDNLDRESYRTIRELILPILGTDAQIIRNICPNCWRGNDTDSLGDPIEGHTEALLDRLGPDDVFTLDGLGYRYDTELQDDQLTMQRVRELKALAIERGVSYFGLWRKQRQGLGNQLIHPDDRSYEVPTDTQVEADIALLRYGLELE